MAGIIHHPFILRCLALVFLFCSYLCTASLLCQKECRCSAIALPGALSDDANSELRENCTCPEHGIIPEYVLHNADKLDLHYSKPVILSSGNIKKFYQITFLNISGIQFVEPGGFQGLETLEWLALYDNYMRVLESNMFIDLGNLSRLTVEGTTKHKIHALENGTFCTLTKLKFLNLKANAFTDLIKEHFRDLETLDKIHLSDNRLTQIKADTFIHAPLLTEIYLSKNLITEIHQYAFNGLKSLVTLALEGNRIKGMPQPVFSPGSLGGSNVLHYDVTISLDDNPLRCDCHLNWISSWLDVDDQHCDGLCLTPSKFNKQSLEHVYKDGLPQCQPSNTIRSVEPGKQLELTCPFAGASWVTPDRRSFQEHGDCDDPFYLTNSDSLVIWKTTPELSGNYTCLSSDGTQAFFYQVDNSMEMIMFIYCKQIWIKLHRQNKLGLQSTKP
eukprot:XP_011666488.1 PREDICTED: slit homolog 3 protein-like [Strongylocentrotus purpuratus]